MISQILLDRHLFIQQISTLMPDTVLDSGDIGINKTEKNPYTPKVYIPVKLGGKHTCKMEIVSR